MHSHTFTNIKNLLISIIIVYTGLLCVHAQASDTISYSTAPTAINVKDFGAIGNGKHDDTSAIQKAVNSFVKQYKTQLVRVSYRGAPRGGGIAYHAHSAIVFPPGTYRITRPIVFDSRYAYILGLGDATIVQSNPSKLIFYFDGTWQTRIRNMHFKGGSTQLYVWTGNKNGALVFVDHCTFTNSGDYAINQRSYAVKKMNAREYTVSKNWAPFKVSWDGGKPTLTPNQANNLHSTFNSTLTTVSHCKFINCMKVADFSADHSIIRDSKITVNPKADGPIMFLANRPHLYRVTGVMNPAPGKHPYWIERGGIISVRHSQFKTTGGRGSSLLRITKDRNLDKAKFKNTRLCVVIDDCKVDAAGSRGNSIFWMRKDIQPSILSMTNITGISGYPVRAVMWDDPSAFTHLNTFSTTTDWQNAKLKDLYKIEFAYNSPNIKTTLPKALRPFKQKPVPKWAMKATYVALLPWDFSDLKTNIKHTIYAESFGLDANPKTDDTAVVQKIFKAAEKKGFCQVVFPGQVIKLSKTIKVPSNVIVRAAGVAVFKAANPDMTLFSVPDAGHVGFADSVFIGGRIGVDITTNDKIKARIGFINCWFAQQMIGVRCMSGQGRTGEKNNTQLLIDQCEIKSVQAVVTNAAHSQLTSFWGQNDPRLNDAAFIENRGGEMRVQGMLGVPVLWDGGGADAKSHRFPAGWKYSNNTRWIDNWGKIYCLDNRFGGEFKGMCIVFNRSKQGTVYIGGGIARHRNAVTKKCILYMKKLPEVAVLRNISDLPVNFEGINRIMKAKGLSGTTNIFCSGVMVPWIK